VGFKMKKLSRKEADRVLYLAGDEIRQFSCLRLGQAICNILPMETLEIIIHTEHDFYYWQDDSQVMDTFYKLLVEEV
jgi:hypothetical protein